MIFLACIIFLCSVFPVISSQTEKKGDFLIISEPHRLSIFNQFEQAMTENELSNIPAYSPFLIISRKETLGDQITEALRCKFQGTTCFILFDAKGNFRGSNPQLYQKTFQNCLIINDTVELKKAISAYQKYSSSGTVIRCNANQPVVRLFKYSGAFYVFFPDKNQFGWINNGPEAFKSSVKNTSQSQKYSINDISGMIETRINAANEIYNRYFEYFNKTTHLDKSIPQWKLHSDGKKLKCTLSSSALVTEQLQKSTRYVLQDIEQLLLGKPFNVQYNSGEITINPR